MHRDHRRWRVKRSAQDAQADVRVAGAQRRLDVTLQSDGAAQREPCEWRTASPAIDVHLQSQRAPAATAGRQQGVECREAREQGLRLRAVVAVRLDQQAHAPPPVGAPARRPRNPSRAAEHQGPSHGERDGRQRRATIAHLSDAGRAGGRRLALCEPELRRGPSGAVAVRAVLSALRAEAGGNRQWAARLVVATQLLQGATETEVRVVIRRGGAGNRVELRGGLPVALAVEECAAERLANRGLVRLELPRTLQRHGGSRIVAALQQRDATLVQVVDVLLHALHSNGPLSANGEGAAERAAEQLRLALCAPAREHLVAAP
jgi:hypothetical protein